MSCFSVLVLVALSLSYVAKSSLSSAPWVNFLSFLINIRSKTPKATVKMVNHLKVVYSVSLCCSSKTKEILYHYHFSNLKEINKLMKDKPYLLEILKKGTEMANIKAEENLKNIRDIVGLI